MNTSVEYTTYNVVFKGASKELKAFAEQICKLESDGEDGYYIKGKYLFKVFLNNVIMNHSLDYTDMFVYGTNEELGYEWQFVCHIDHQN